jgi:UDP-GlcNAc:undecaprenyl-phosphate GlcNAc-1-phosphate transferase
MMYNLSILNGTIAFIVLLLMELLYFRIARRYGIIDKPNHRSSHTKYTLRGGGVVFSAGLFVVYPLFSGVNYSYFMFGLLLIAFVSFLDDVKPISSLIRILVHIASAGLMFHQVDLYSLSIYWVLLALVFTIGTINSINFMDGINGMTGAYALVTVSTLFYLNNSELNFINPFFITTVILSILVFNIFNFRQRAVCFAGDVGSIGIAFIIIFLLTLLIIKSNNVKYLTLLFIYGLDTITTIGFRLIRRENIFEAHRTHFYQFLVNHKGYSHLTVATIYSLSQLLFNILLLTVYDRSSLFPFVAVTIISLSFLTLRFGMEGKKLLIGNPTK